MQFAGLSVNSVTYIGMVLSIGLIVDYCMHYLLRYIETPGFDREERVKEALRTIGASVVLGGLSTLLGVVPLGFSTSEIIRTVFVIFIALVALGLSHGLILLPVVLSLVGPLNYLPELHGTLGEDKQIKVRRASRILSSKEMTKTDPEQPQSTAAAHNASRDNQRMDDIDLD